MLKSVNKSDKRGCTVQYPGSILRKYDVDLCVIVSSEPFRTVAYSVEQEQLLDDAETENLLSDVRCLLINFRSSDERYFAAKLIKTVSVQTLFSIASSYPFHEDDLDYVLRQTIHMHYSSIFSNTKVDFSNLFCMESFWKKIGKVILECLDTIDSHSLNNYVDLEI